MKLLAFIIVSVVLTSAALAQRDSSNTTKPASHTPMLTRTDIQSVSPALDRYTQVSLLGDLWKRPDLSPRDRSIATLAALIARNQTIEMPYYFNLAIDSGVKPSEISEIITHLAFYSGWPNVFSAVPVVKGVFDGRPN